MDHASVPTISPLDGKTDDRGLGSSLSANPASLKGREGDRRKTKRKGRGGGKAGKTLANDVTCFYNTVPNANFVLITITKLRHNVQEKQSSERVTAVTGKCRKGCFD